jgi:hypothetical protein
VRLDETPPDLPAEVERIRWFPLPPVCLR